ncbi:MAG: tyrosine-protein phosphatase [Burkholderiaceae bacterium]|nr:tyrosine-protein phosphatase [Burkholderiaceae bacterium]
MPRHPDRVWRLQGAPNFRDLGGYIGHGGRPLRWRLLFRSDHLADLTADDRARLQPLRITRTFDLRGIDERAAAPYELPGATQHSLAIEPTVVQRMHDIAASGTPLTAPVVTELMTELYRGLVNDRADRFAELFEHLIESDAPSVFHCTAGKDRTGIAAALVLLALGVPRDVVRADYLLTNELVRDPAGMQSATPLEARAVLWRVQQGFLDAALRIVDADHGGLDRYLTQRLRLSPAALRTLAERYLQPSDTT